jgi:hypothetical protein
MAEELIIAEATVSKQGVYLISGEMSGSIGPIWGVTGTDWRRTHSTSRKEGLKGGRSDPFR